MIPEEQLQRMIAAITTSIHAMVTDNIQALILHLEDLTRRVEELEADRSETVAEIDE